VTSGQKKGKLQIQNPKGSPWRWRAGPTRLFRAPRETGAEKEKKQMIEQIKQTHRGQFNVEGSLQVRTVDAPRGAERKLA
jgi:hypothetical protein